MGTLLVRAIVILLLPAAVFFGGFYLIGKLSNREEVTRQLGKLPNKKDQKPLGVRICGYNVGAVATHWGALDKKALEFERRSLEIDLLFPFFYGAAFAGALLCAWAALDRSFNPAWILAPVLVEVVADWIENFIQLGQLRLFKAGGALQPGWIQIASVATILKVVFFWVSCFLVVILVGRMIFNNWPRAPAR